MSNIFFFNKKIHSTIYYYLLLFTSLFFIWGNFLASLSCYFIIAHWIFEGNYKHKIKYIFKSKSPLLFIGIFTVFFLWAVFQLPNKKALDDIWVNFPLLIFAISIGTRPRLLHSQFFYLVFFFVISITINTAFEFTYYSLHKNEYTDVRQMSIFMSYIRLTLYTIIGIIISIYYLYYNKTIQLKMYQRAIFYFAVVWLLFIVFYLGSLTGYIVMLTLSVVFAISQSLKQREIRSKIIALLIVFFTISVAVYIVSNEMKYFTHPDAVEFNESDTTLLGNKYTKFNGKGIIENGHWVGAYVCEEELYENWRKFSSIPLWGRDQKNQPLKYTLMRYMTSRNLRKDASGLKQLSENEIRLIESGCTNYRFGSDYNVLHRVYEVIWEFHMYIQFKNPAGHSVTQRIEFFKCGLEVFKQNFVWGTGPAYVQEKMHQQYEKQPIKMPKHLWYKPHNQFLLFGVMYGIIGFSIIMFAFLSFIIIIYRHASMLYVCWIVIIFLSFLNEDMLDSLNGLLFFAFFGCLFLCAQPKSIKLNEIVGLK